MMIMRETVSKMSFLEIVRLENTSRVSQVLIRKEICM